MSSPKKGTRFAERNVLINTYEYNQPALLANTDLITQRNSQTERITSDLVETMKGLDALQASRSAWVDAIVLKLGLGLQHRHLQPKVQELIHIEHYDVATGGLWDAVLDNAHPKKVADAALEFTVINSQLDAPGAGLSMLDGVRKHRYSLFYFNCGDHWVATILRASTSGGKTTIHNAVIAEPVRSASLRIFLFARLQEIFTAPRGFVFEQKEIQDFWFPTQNDYNSCGFRTYEILKTVMLRINDEYIRNPSGPVYNDSIFAPMSGDFQQDKVRAELIGIMAVEAIRVSGYNTRLMLGPFETIVVSDVQGTRLVSRGSEDAKLFHDTLARVQRGPDATYGTANAAGSAGPATPARAAAAGPATPATHWRARIPSVAVASQNTPGTSGGSVKKSTVTRSAARKRKQFGYWQ